jgi:hypothetical protein
MKAKKDLRCYSSGKVPAHQVQGDELPNHGQLCFSGYHDASSDFQMLLNHRTLRILDKSPLCEPRQPHSQ